MRVVRYGGRETLQSYPSLWRRPAKTSQLGGSLIGTTLSNLAAISSSHVQPKLFTHGTYRELVGGISRVWSNTSSHLELPNAVEQGKSQAVPQTKTEAPTISLFRWHLIAQVPFDSLRLGSDTSPAGGLLRQPDAIRKSQDSFARIADEETLIFFQQADTQACERNYKQSDIPTRTPTLGKNLFEYYGG